MKTTNLLLLLAVIAIPLTAQENPIFPEPDEHSVAFWDFSRQSDGQFEDESGFGSTVALKAMEKAKLPQVTSDGLLFDGKGGYAEINGGEALRITGGDFSIDIIFKSDSAEALQNKPVAYLAGNKSLSEKRGFALALSNWQKNHVVFYYALNGQAEALEGAFEKSILKTGVFHHLQVSFSEKRLSLFLNGIKLAEKELPGPVSLVNSRRIRLGIYPAPWQRDKQDQLIVNGFEGCIRLLRFSDKGRTGK